MHAPSVVLFCIFKSAQCSTKNIVKSRQISFEMIFLLAGKIPGNPFVIKHKQMSQFDEGRGEHSFV